MYKVRCHICGKEFTSLNALEHVLKTKKDGHEHNSWKLLLKEVKE